METGFLEVRDVHKRFGKTPALQGVSLLIERGEIFGLLGPNGAGKTTLLSIMSGLLDAESGSVRLDGQTIQKASMTHRWRIGLGTQENAIYPELTAAENLYFFARLYQISNQETHARCQQLLEAVGLHERAHDRVSTYSGGMKRRLNLAVTMIHNPEVVFLDEPTTGVDPQSRNLIYQFVRNINAQGKTIVYTSHYLEEVEALCKRIAIIDAGMVRACDTLTELLKLLATKIIIRARPMTEPLLQSLRALPSTRHVVTTAESVEFETDAPGPVLTQVVEIVRQHGLALEAVHLREPTLEKVFLHLTGHALRD